MRKKIEYPPGLQARTDMEKIGLGPGKKCLLSWICPGIL